MFSFDGDILEGGLPLRAAKLVQEWLKEHRIERSQNWEYARSGQALKTIEPLE